MRIPDVIPSYGSKDRNETQLQKKKNTKARKNFNNYIENKEVKS